MPEKFDVAIVGAGPAGLGAALELERRGFSTVTFDRGGIADSLSRYPPGMRFFTTRERIEIGGVPLTVPDAKPTREQALAYYRAVALSHDLRVRPFEEVQRIDGEAGRFEVHTQQRSRGPQVTQASAVVVASGTFALPNPLGVPGEERDKVEHYYTEGHRHARRDVAVVGAGNSAAEAALDLFRCGARVTLIHRGDDLSQGLKYWVEPDLRNRIREGSIRAHLGTRVVAIEPDHLQLMSPTGALRLDNDHVFAMTGYRPDPDLFQRLELAHDPETLAPAHDPDTFQSSRPGVFVIGSLVSGKVSGRVFIENGRHHGRVLAEHLMRQRGTT